MSKSETSPALELAKEKHEQPDETDVVILRGGVSARLVPVSATLIDNINSRIPDPEVPVQMIEEKGREEPNPLDPRYKQALIEADQKRTAAVLDAFAMFGVELLDDLPSDKVWLYPLRKMEAWGHIDLSAYDLKDPIDKEFVYKRFYALSSQDLIKIGRLSGITSEEVEAAISGFQGQET